MKNINQPTLISTCRTVCKCVCMDFADVFLTCRTVCKCVCKDFADVFPTCAAHSICVTVFLWETELESPPLACPSCSLRWIRTRFSPLNSFHKHCRGCCVGKALPTLNVWGYKCLSQLLQEHHSLVLLIRHSGTVDLVPYHEGFV